MQINCDINNNRWAVIDYRLENEKLYKNRSIIYQIEKSVIDYNENYVNTR